MTATKTMAPKAAKSTTKKQATKKAKPLDAGEQKMSALDAAAKVLTEKGVAMTCPELIGVMAAKGYWSSPNGKTPAATLAAAILREITVKGDAARFAKTAPGRFAARGAPGAKGAAGPAASSGGTTSNAPDADAIVPVPRPSKATTAKAKKATPKAKSAAKNSKKEPAAEPIPDGTPGPDSVAELFRI